jgi:uncharacterized peroxidase-related enzyme
MPRKILIEPERKRNVSTTEDMLFAPVTIAAAPEMSKPMLEKVQKSLGFIPNLIAIFANNPTVLEGYLALGRVFEKSSSSPTERQLILLAASVENNCNYCAAAHSAIAKSLLTPPEIIAAVHGNTHIPDPKLNALVSLVRELVRERGYAEAKTIQKFLAAGYAKEQVMEILLGIALKTISNYLDHISPTPLDR